MSWLKALAAVLALSTSFACLNDDGPVQDPATLRLQAEGSGALTLEIDGTIETPAAFQASFVLSSADHSIQLASASPVDRVRIESRGAGRFVAFVGDGAGRNLPSTGVLAQLTIVDGSGNGASGGTARIDQASLASAGGQLIEIDVHRSDVGY